MAIEIATFAAGCFWGVEAAFLRVSGVVDSTSGYTGGHVEQPTYREVCSSTTGHAEAVMIKFDTEKISFEELTDVFFSIHDPTQLNRQGPDHGPQYRSSIFFHSDEQREIAQTAMKRAQVKFEHPIVTEVVAAGQFWPAEEYHQRYLEKNGTEHCRVPSTPLNR